MSVTGVSQGSYRSATVVLQERYIVLEGRKAQMGL
jgi:hypothetical protein